MSRQPPPPDDDPEDEWPDIEPPFVGFVPLDDRMADRAHTRRLMQEVWKSIQARWANPWKQDNT